MAEHIFINAFVYTICFFLFCFLHCITRHIFSFLFFYQQRWIALLLAVLFVLLFNNCLPCNFPLKFLAIIIAEQIYENVNILTQLYRCVIKKLCSKWISSSVCVNLLYSCEKNRERERANHQPGIRIFDLKKKFFFSSKQNL